MPQHERTLKIFKCGKPVTKDSIVYGFIVRSVQNRKSIMVADRPVAAH